MKIAANTVGPFGLRLWLTEVRRNAAGKVSETVYSQEPSGGGWPAILFRITAQELAWKESEQA
jgi:hypothetical protein